MWWPTEASSSLNWIDSWCIVMKMVYFLPLAASLSVFILFFSFTSVFSELASVSSPVGINLQCSLSVLIHSDSLSGSLSRPSKDQESWSYFSDVEQLGAFHRRMETESRLHFGWGHICGACDGFNKNNSSSLLHHLRATRAFSLKLEAQRQWGINVAPKQCKASSATGSPRQAVEETKDCHVK